MSSLIDVVLIDYAGHGTRMGEPMNGSLEEMLRDVAGRIRDQADKEDYYILGYSMGSLLAYILSSDMSYNINPAHLFLCSFQSPDVLKEKRFLIAGTDSEEAFIERYGNIDERIIKDPRFAEVFTAPLINDFYCLSNYEPTKLLPVSCGITVLYGDSDFSKEDLTGWKLFSTQRTDIQSLPGTHFFLNENIDSVCRIVQQNCK